MPLNQVILHKRDLTTWPKDLRFFLLEQTCRESAHKMQGIWQIAVFVIYFFNGLESKIDEIERWPFLIYLFGSIVGTSAQVTSPNGTVGFPSAEVGKRGGLG